MRKRPTLKGKGADIFLSKVAQQPKKETIQGKEKATFYLPPPLVAKLDDAWFMVRKNADRKARKSDIVRAALEEFLKDFEKGSKTSILVKHFNITT